MDMEKKLGDGLKKLVLLGIGAAAMTAEKSQQMVDELVKKGEITVEQGKELNQELKRSVKKSFDEFSETVEQKEAERGAQEVEFEKKIAGMTADELEKMSDLIAKALDTLKKDE